MGLCWGRTIAYKIIQTENLQLAMNCGRSIEVDKILKEKIKKNIQEIKLKCFGCLQQFESRCNIVFANGYYVFVFTRKPFACTIHCMPPHFSLPYPFSITSQYFIIVVSYPPQFSIFHVHRPSLLLIRRRQQLLKKWFSMSKSFT